MVRSLYVSAVFSDPVGSKVHPPPPSANNVRSTIGCRRARRVTHHRELRKTCALGGTVSAQRGGGERDRTRCGRLRNSTELGFISAQLTVLFRVSLPGQASHAAQVARRLVDAAADAHLDAPALVVRAVEALEGYAVAVHERMAAERAELERRGVDTATFQRDLERGTRSPPPDQAGL